MRLRRPDIQNPRMRLRGFRRSWSGRPSSQDISRDDYLFLRLGKKGHCTAQNHECGYDHAHEEFGFTTNLHKYPSIAKLGLKSNRYYRPVAGRIPLQGEATGEAIGVGVGEVFALCD